jgi:hypothetical protein
MFEVEGTGYLKESWYVMVPSQCGSHRQCGSNVVYVDEVRTNAFH